MVKLAVLLAILPAPLQAIIPTPCLTSPSSCSGGDPSALRPLPHHPGTYMLTVTGSGAGEAFGVRYLSEDGWTSGPDSFLSPSWSATYLGNPRPAFWAPDLPTTSATTMFYSISSGGMETDDAGTSSLMCIGVATGTIHSLRNISWVDHGAPVLCISQDQADQGAPHAIDPSVSMTAGGMPVLTFGSWSNYGDGPKLGARGGGVWAVDLDPDTLALPQELLDLCGDNFPNCFDATEPRFRNIANHRGYNSPDGYVDGNSIEGSYLFDNLNDMGYYYLFVNWFWCCRGVDSTYQIMVGRSKSKDGPFLDKNGADLADNDADTEGTVVMESNTDGYVGAGHAGILQVKGEGGKYEYVFTNHFEATPDCEGGFCRTLQATRLRFFDGWPTLMYDEPILD